MSNQTVNELACEQIEKIAEEQSIKLSPEYKQRIMSWKIDALKKIWAIGADRKTDKKVLIKVRPTGSILPLTDFVETEQREKLITDFLSKRAIPTERILREQLTDEPQWVLREFREGKPIGKMSYSKELDETKLFETLKELFLALDAIPKPEVTSNFPERNWMAKWQSEFIAREHLIVKYLGEDVKQQLRSILSEQPTSTDPKALLHNDLSPQNIIETNQGFSVIDWGEASCGPRVIDWGTVWSFAFFHPILQDKIVTHLSNNSNDNEQNMKLFLAICARLLSSVAEYHDYRQNLGEDSSDYDRNSLGVAWERFCQLQKALR